MSTVCSDPIDFVFTWVDGSDPVWAKKKQDCLQQICPDSNEGTQACRFRNRDELKYALRSINDFASFINHIFIVTDEQRPTWLKDHAKVTVVSHSEIFPNKEDLPSFNASAIEANLHRIKGLAERYIFSNDDFLLGNRVSEDDFFTRDGNIRFFETEKKIPHELTKEQKGNSLMRRAWNTSQELRRVYGEEKEHFFLYHIPYVMRKSLVQDVEAKFSQVFKEVSAAKFRSIKTCRITCCLVQYVGLYTGRAEKSQGDYYYFPFHSNVQIDGGHMEKLFTRRPKFFCVQDDKMTGETEEGERKLHGFFEKYFPNPAPWEK